MLTPFKKSRTTMKLTFSTAATLLALVLSLLSPLAMAGPGHDHGEVVFLAVCNRVFISD
jgi:hypothetical protein